MKTIVPRIESVYLGGVNDVDWDKAKNGDGNIRLPEEHIIVDENCRGGRLVGKIFESLEEAQAYLDAHREEIICLKLQTAEDSLSHLSSAAMNGNMVAAELLIAKGVDVNAEGTLEVSPLFIASLKGHIDIVDLLIANGADINANLRIAAIRGRSNVAELLIAKGADVNWKNNDGTTPLHLAAQKGHKEVVELLIAKGGDVNSCSNYGHTPLHVATDKGHMKVVELLIAKGAKVSAKDT